MSRADTSVVPDVFSHCPRPDNEAAAGAAAEAEAEEAAAILPQHCRQSVADMDRHVGQGVGSISSQV